jgi:hypothetical protein
MPRGTAWRRSNMQLTYTIDQLAVLFQRSASTLRPLLDRLAAEHGFPSRLPMFENLWSKPAVDRWFEQQGQPAPVAETADTLLQRYGGQDGRA